MTLTHKLRVYINLDTLVDLRSDSRWTPLEGASRFKRLETDGFEGIQLTNNDEVPFGNHLPYCGLDRINAPSDSDSIVRVHSDRGDLCLTVHAGWGLEEEEDVFRLVESILTASGKYSLPVYIETHRATITQDLWRTVRITKQFPEVRFNADFSHYYTGQELVYGNWKEKLDFMEPIFLRTRFIHGRIGSPGCMQVSIDEDDSSRPQQAHGMINFLEHYKELWTRAMRGFLETAGATDQLIFAPELLAGTHYYARLFPNARGHLEEESDRYQQALVYQRIARKCFESAIALQSGGTVANGFKIISR